MNSEPVVIEDDDVDNGNVVVIDDDVRIIEQKAASPIVIDDDPQAELNEVTCNDNGGTETNILSQKESNANRKFITNLRNNNLMDKIIQTCMNMPNGAGMERVVQKTLVPLYRDSNPTLKRSRTLTKLLKNMHKMLLRDPDHKFLHIKTLCEELKSGRLRKKVPFVTLATNLREDEKFSDSTDTQTDLWHSGPSEDRLAEPNRCSTVTDVVVVNCEDEIQENPKPQKRKYNTRGRKRKPNTTNKKVTVTTKRRKKISNTVNTKTDVIELDNSDHETDNLHTCVEATASVTNEGSERISPNPSTEEDSNKENNESNLENEHIGSRAEVKKAEMENNECQAEKESNESKAEKENNKNKLEQENDKFRHKINTLFNIPIYSIPIIQNPLLAVNSTIQLKPILTIDGMNPVPQDNNISKTVAVIEYNSSQNENNLHSEDDIEVFIPQTHIENHCTVSDDTPNTINIKEICDNTETEINQYNGSREFGMVQDILVPKNLKENGIVRDLLVPRNRTENGIVQSLLVPKNPRKNGIIQDDVVQNPRENGIDQDLLVPRNQTENEIDEDLLIPKHHIEVIVSDDKPYDPKIVAFYECCIAKYKKELAELEELEVTSDSPKFSPYVMCGKLKQKIVETYKKICAIIGSSATIAKRCEIRLNVAEDHHPGPAKQLERFLNSTIGEDGLVKFPDFEEVLQCVYASNREDVLGWSYNQIFKEASALFVQCGKALRKRRQKREYQDLISLMRDKAIEDDDPAEKDPLLLAKLEQNKQIAKRNENEILNRFAAMENMRDPVPEENSTVVFESDKDSTDSDSEDCEEDILSNQIERIQNVQDTPSTVTGQAKDTLDINCKTPSLLQTILLGNATEYNETKNNNSVMNASSFENSALLNSSQTSLGNNMAHDVIERKIEPSSPKLDNAGNTSPILGNVGNLSLTNVKNSPLNAADSLAIDVKDEGVVSKDNNNCERDNITEEKISIDNIKEEKEPIKINFSKPIDSISLMPNCNNSSTNTDSMESNVKRETTVKLERLDIEAMLKERGDNFECTVFDIEDPFLVIEISSDDYSDEDDL